MRLALVGFGRWGTKLARAFRRLERVELAAVCDPDPGARARAGDLVPGARVSASFAELVRETGAGAAVIATPPVTHARLGLAALEAGLDVFLEKPMSLSLEDARSLERLSERTGRSLMVGHILEYHPAIAELRRRIARGELGEVRLIVSERLGPSQSRHENAWWSLAPHDLSVLRHLTGAEPLRVQVRGERDVAVGRVEASGGLVALVHASFAAGDKIRRITVVGTRAGAVFEDGARPSLRTFSLDRGVERALELARAFSPPEALGRGSLDGVAPAVWLPGGGSPIPIEPREPLMCEAEHFVEAVLDRAPIRSDAESGRRVVAALEAGQRSLASGGSIEDVPRR